MAEILIIKGKPQTVSYALWRRYGRRVVGLVELVYAHNPGLAALGPILPIGTEFSVEPPLPKTKVKVVKLIRLTGR